MKDLFSHLPAANIENRRAIYEALGRARHSIGLKWLNETEPGEDPQDRLSHSLALLALGNSSQTGTITRSLVLGKVSERRFVSRVLATMRQVRPKKILQQALSDGDDVVRLNAIRRLGRSRVRATREVLLELTKSDKVHVRQEASKLLAKGRHRLDLEILNQLPEPMRSQLYVSAASRHPRKMKKVVKSDVFSSDRLKRSASLAAMVHILSYREFKRIQKKITKRFKKDIVPELAMTLALYNQEDGWIMLDTLDKDELERSIGVLAAYVGAGRRRSKISTVQAERLGGRFEAWMQTDLLTKEYETRVIDSLAVLEPNVALNIARKRIQLKDGPGLRAALRYLAKHGDINDLPPLIALLKTKLSEDSLAKALTTAATLCQH
ncbi:MAG: HEAT repeat domain-containing protein [Myxococcota bacterium]|nr:HEAT repeat domain-containing protein [Myxococcota bacterium]